MDDNCTSAFWLASRATHRVLTRAPIIELALSDPATVFRDARREATLMLAQQPTDELRATALLIGAHGVRRAGELPPNWLAMCVEIAGSPWPDRLPASARILCRPSMAHDLAGRRRTSLFAICDGFASA